jgi:hypothetical protein
MSLMQSEFLSRKSAAQRTRLRSSRARGKALASSTRPSSRALTSGSARPFHHGKLSLAACLKKPGLGAGGDRARSSTSTHRDRTHHASSSTRPGRARADSSKLPFDRASGSHASASRRQTGASSRGERHGVWFGFVGAPSRHARWLAVAVPCESSGDARARRPQTPPPRPPPTRQRVACGRRVTPRRGERLGGVERQREGSTRIVRRGAMRMQVAGARASARPTVGRAKNSWEAAWAERQGRPEPPAPRHPARVLSGFLDRSSRAANAVFRGRGR